MKCPDCALINPDGASRCDCGYDFSSGLLTESHSRRTHDGISFTEAVSSGFQRYVDFDGRSRRSEYWYWTLFVVLVSIAVSVIDAATTGYLLGAVFSLAAFLPGLAVSIRRLHDIDRPGWWVLLGFVLVIGWIVLIVWYTREGTNGENRFGAEPL